jgi:hypothetical protein
MLVLYVSMSLQAALAAQTWSFSHQEIRMVIYFDVNLQPGPCRWKTNSEQSGTERSP